MGFKLIRLDSDEPTKISLKVGTHIIGRGSFLNCDDQRVSRQHGVLKVTESAVVLKSLHQNPCFYNKQELKKTALLSQGNTIPLSNSDHFGLLPDTYWYELIFYDDNNQSIPLRIDQDNSMDTEMVNGNGKTDLNEETRVLTGYDNSGMQEVCYQAVCDDDIDSELLNLEFEETMEDDKGDESQSLITGNNPVPGDPTTAGDNPVPDDPSSTQPAESKGDETFCDESTPRKRSHTPDPSRGSKKVKTEPETAHEDPEQIESTETRISEEERPKSPIYEDTDSQTTNIIVQQNAKDLSMNSTDMDGAKDNTDAESNVDTDPSSPKNEVKKEPKSPTVKAEPLSPKKEKKETDLPKPGPSHDQAGSSNDGAAAKPPNQPIRERCIYGANCYSPVDDGSRRRRVNYAQQEILAKFLDVNRDLAKGFNKNAKARELCKRRWETAAEILNAEVDGSFKDWKGWSSAKKTTVFKLETSRAVDVKSDPQPANIILPRPMPRHTCRPLRRHGRHMTEEAARRSLVEIARASHEESRRNGIALENILYQVTRIADAFERKNPQHKAQFSHPSDADHGGGARGPCPYGGSCRRRDPRHWALHDHPPGTRAPHQGPQPGNRAKRPKRVVKTPSESEDSEQDSPSNLIVHGKRKRKPVKRETWSDSEEEIQDPYGTDESDEWEPSSDVTQSQSQGF